MWVLCILDMHVLKPQKHSYYRYLLCMYMECIINVGSVYYILFLVDISFSEVKPIEYIVL